ncbi:MAG: hypothetical protein LRZ85_06930 [Alphaproteobacteria bacterium]|nr:hypothetical protein [Alphaproteobacteria bacterium]
MLSNLEKPSLIVIIRSGGGACCAVHSLNEERLYLMTLQKLEKQLGDKFGTPEYPIPTFNDFIKMAAGWSAGNVGGVAQVLGKQPKETGVLWERIAPHILPAVEEVRKLLIRQAVKGIHAELRNGDVPPEQRNRGFWGPLAKVGFSLARHFFLSRGGSGSLYTNNDVLLGLAQLGRNLTGQFDGQDVRIENNGWDPFLKEMGVFDKKAFR